MVKSGQAWSGLVVTRDATGALATPSVGPAGVLYVDGVSNGASVTVSGANPYKWSVTLPSLTAGQSVSVYVTATIATIETAAVVAEDVADTVRMSDTLTANMSQISGDATAADNLETMLDGTGGAQLTLKKFVINNTDPTGVAIQVNAYNAINIDGANRGVYLHGGTNQALYMATDYATTTVYVEGPATGGKGISILSPSDGTSLPGASGIYIQTEAGHPAILIDFTDPADAVKVVNSDNGDWVWDDKLFAAATDAASAVRTELAVELAHLDADVSSVGGAGSGAITHTITVNDGANPLEGVEVWITTDVGGSNVVAGTATTDSLGKVTFYLDAGTYYAWQQLTGYTFTNPTTITVA